MRENYTAHTSPGKFEGEGPITEYVYSLVMDGDSGEDSEWGTGSSYNQFGKRVLCEDDRGFVTLRKFDSKDDADKFMSDRHDECETGEDD